MSEIPPAHDPALERAQRLGPLLAAVACELRERSEALKRLLVEREQAAGPGCAAECATHRAALRQVHRELARLDCRLVSLHPLVFRVAARGTPEHALLWCVDCR
jgi:hypothetical protein